MMVSNNMVVVRAENICESMRTQKVPIGSLSQVYKQANSILGKCSASTTQSQARYWRRESRSSGTSNQVEPMQEARTDRWRFGQGGGVAVGNWASYR